MRLSQAQRLSWAILGASQWWEHMKGAPASLTHSALFGVNVIIVFVTTNTQTKIS